MLDTDTLLMNRAIVLARQGAGLVSPNPMVGAVLINDGRVVGEGFHRYDLLKHAEAYAIETAGELARGATLYCNLEPCCHHGRTPPCTDALIKAGIARAVIAVKDPDPRVNGRGIEQLRQADIEVEVGLLEDRALRINEIYFKFITTGAPFIHAVIQYPADSSISLVERARAWYPSNELLQTISEYDALMIGGRPNLARLVLDKALQRERYRPLIVAAGDDEPWVLEALRERIASGEVQVVGFDTEPPAPDGGNIMRMDEGIVRGVLWSQTGSLKSTLARKNITSLLILPGVFDSGEPLNFAEFDKATLLIPGPLPEQRSATNWSFGDIEFDLEDVSITEADGFTELTGYPSVREVA
jgi:pyrimidine deaminase RibD-like protein